MPKDYILYRRLIKEGVITQNLLNTATQLRTMKPIPTDVMKILTEDQSFSLAKIRHDTCLSIQIQLEELYRKHYKKHNLPWEHPIMMACIKMGHDGNRTLEYVNKMLEENKPRVALAHIDHLPDILLSIQRMFCGLDEEVDISIFFSETPQGE